MFPVFEGRGQVWGPVLPALTYSPIEPTCSIVIVKLFKSFSNERTSEVTPSSHIYAPLKKAFKDTLTTPCCGMKKIVQWRDHKQKIFIPEQVK